MGLNFHYYDGLQPKIRAGIINEHECNSELAVITGIKYKWICVLTFSGLSSSRLRKVLILLMETAPWIIDTIPKGSKKSGPLIVLKSVRDTNAVSESKMLLAGSTRTNVANEAKATNKMNWYLHHAAFLKIHSLCFISNTVNDGLVAHFRKFHSRCLSVA